MHRDALENILPHRKPMLLLDEANRLDESSGEAFYTVQGNEFFLQGHFPGNPIVPGVIQCEMMAQSCAVILDGHEGKTPLFTGIQKCKFKHPVKPGDTIHLQSTITKAKAPFYFATCKASVNGRVVSEADISFALVDQDV